MKHCLPQQCQVYATTFSLSSMSFKAKKIVDTPTTMSREVSNRFKKKMWNVFK